MSPPMSLDIGGLSSNIISDFGPILALFGEQVAKQFMSQSMGWADHIIFAMAPLGIITAVVGAIRVGGPGWLKAIVGRARESRALAEVELMSSTSHEVCEMWDGQNLVRIMGSPEIHELIHVSPSVKQQRTIYASNEGCRQHRPGPPTCNLWVVNEKYNNDNEQNIGYPFEQLNSQIARPRKSNGDTQATIIDPENPANTNESGFCHKSSAPNISLNLHSAVTEQELYLVALLGVIIQGGVLVYAYCSTYSLTVQGELGVSSPLAWAWYCTLTGTMGVVAGMLGCSFIIEKSTIEKIHRVKGGEAHILWLQKGTTVNDQVFNSYAIFTKRSRSTFMTSCRNDDVTDPNHIVSSIFGAMTTAVAALSTIGFIAQFMGLRGMHWSVPVAQILATILMTILRAVVRRGLSECPHSQQLPLNHEMDWLATRIARKEDQLRLWKGPEDSHPLQQRKFNSCIQYFSKRVMQREAPRDKFWQRRCYKWKIITGVGCGGYQLLKDSTMVSGSGVDAGRAQAVVDTRKRLGYLTRWPGAYSDRATSVAAAIEHVMNTLEFDTEATEFSWSMEAWEGQSIHFKVRYSDPESSAPARWVADLAEIEATLSLWMFSIDQDDAGVPREKNRDEKGAWLRSGKASREQAIRILGPSNFLLRRDVKLWVGDGTQNVLEVDLSKSETGTFDSKLLIKRGDCRVVGHGGKKLTDGLYKTRPLTGISLSLHKNETNACLVTVSETPQDLLFAQEMFTSFMWNLVKSTKVKIKKIGGQTTVQAHVQQLAVDTPAWQAFTLQNSTLSKLAQAIERDGLGSLEDVYMSIIPPLSAQEKLLDPAALVDYLHQQAGEYQSSGNWKAAAEMYSWALQTCSPLSSNFDCIGSRGSSSTVNDHPVELTAAIKAPAVFAEFLRSLHIEAQNLSDHESVRGTTSSKDLRNLRSQLVEELKLSHGNSDLLLPLAHLFKKQRRGEGALDWCPLLNSEQKNIEPIPESFNQLFGHSSLHIQLLSPPAPQYSLNGSKNDLNRQDVLGWTPLHYAANSLNVPALNFLVQKKADWKVRDLAGWTPVHYVAKHPTPEALDHAQFLWESLFRRDSADVDAQGIDGSSPLHCAAKAGNANAMRLLIKVGANTQIYDSSRRTPLHWAGAVGFATNVHLLLGAGANPRAFDSSGRLPLHLVAGRGPKNVAEILMKNVEIDTSDNDLQTPLHIAASNGNKGVVESLLEGGADINRKSTSLKTPLIYATSNGHSEVVQIFLDKGADIEVRNKEGSTPLLLAVGQGNEDLVEIFLGKGANLEAKDKEGSTALLVAVGLESEGGTDIPKEVERKRENLIKMLVEKGADLNVKDNAGRTALLRAVVWENEDLVRMMLEKGADLEAQDNAGVTALLGAVGRGNQNLVKILLEKGVRLEAKDKGDRTALLVAVARENTDLVKMLLEKGANLEAKDTKGSTALLLAVSKDNEDLVKIMLENGADVNVKNKAGMTALMMADDWESEEIVELLLENGAIKEVEDATILGEYAMQEGHLISEILLGVQEDHDATRMDEKSEMEMVRVRELYQM